MLGINPAQTPFTGRQARLIRGAVANNDPIASNPRNATHRGAHWIGGRESPIRGTAQPLHLIRAKRAGHGCIGVNMNNAGFVISKGLRQSIGCKDYGRSKNSPVGRFSTPHSTNFIQGHYG